MLSCWMLSWYGGEPLLNVGCIERLSHQFIEFCDAHIIEYWAVLVSNNYLATEDVADKLLECRVFSDMVTLDGVGEVHDLHRRTKSGKPSYETIMKNILYMQKIGIVVEPGCILDSSNYESCMDLTEPPESRKLNKQSFLEKMNFNPLDRAECRRCNVLPLCQGGCQHKRRNGINSCHVAKFCGKEFLAQYYKALKNQNNG